ncbi:hypothetical protein POM88_013630 [Heracleum sosnowskyi]|uniref:WDR11 TPR domain-containing protein n=1 Tax=Heracleum sosnowskyi TaxID=360622 RepID=A0AAD8J0E5_9APIA|nr:hypothetical protein POM88_013630 [Heracleum sosnowskyi]
MDKKSLQQEIEALLSEKARENEYLLSLQHQIEMLKVVAANMIRTDMSFSGTHMLSAVGRYQEACSQDIINKKLQSPEGLDGLDELVSGGKQSHGPCWLIGRHDVKCVKASTQNTAPPAPTDSYIQELTIAYRLLYCLSTCMF